MVQTEFDLKRGVVSRDLGMSLAAVSRSRLLEIARNFLIQAAREREDRTATADDAYLRLDRAGYDPTQLGNAAGSLFLADQWEFTGEWKPSMRTSNHARMNRVWRLKENQ